MGNGLFENRKLCCIAALTALSVSSAILLLISTNVSSDDVLSSSEDPAEAESEMGAAGPEEENGGSLVSSAADYRVEAQDLQHAIRQVTVYSDQAEVTRAAQLKLKPGLQWVHFGALPQELNRSSIKLRADGDLPASISQVVIEESFDHFQLDPSIKSKVAQLKSLFGEMLGLRQQERALEKSEGLVSGLNFRSPFTHDTALGYLGFSASSDALRSSLEELHQQASTVQAELNRLRDKIRGLDARIELLASEIRGSTSTTDQKWMVHVYCLLDARKAGSGDLELSYRMPRAWWHPVYDLRAELNPESSSAEIRLVTGGLIEQHTGENWEDVKITLSTVDPVPLVYPRLERWVFSETRTEAPTAFAAGAGAPAMDSLSERSEMKAMPQKKAKLTSKADLPVAIAPQEMDRGSVAGAPAAPMGQSLAKEMLADQDSAPRKQEVSRRGKSNRNIAPQEAESLERTQDSGPKAAFPLAKLEDLFPVLREISGKVDALSASVGQFRPVDPSQGGAQVAATQYSDSSLPAVQARGRKMEFASPFLVSLKNDEPPYKMPVHSERLQAKLQYFTIPKMDPRVFLRAEVVNTTSRPILSGSAQIFMQGDLVSKTHLGSVSEGSSFRVDLGTDQNVQAKRVVSKKSAEKGMIFSSHVTDVDVQIELANHHPFPIQVEVGDHYPLAPTDKIEISLSKVTPQAIKSEKGLVKWNVTIPAKQKSTVSFSYRVTHPENYIVSDFN